MTNKPYTTALILAAGLGSRMQSDTTKQTMLVLGKPLLRYTLEAFDRSVLTDAIVVAAREEEYEQSDAEKKEHDPCENLSFSSLYFLFHLYFRHRNPP